MVEEYRYVGWCLTLGLDFESGKGIIVFDSLLRLLGCGGVQRLGDNKDDRLFGVKKGNC